jgi:hypothetical protein
VKEYSAPLISNPATGHDTTSIHAVYIQKIHLNTCLRFPSGSLLDVCPQHSFYLGQLLSFAIPAACPAHHTLLDFTILTKLADLCKSSLCNVIGCSYNPSFLGSNKFKNTFFQIFLTYIFPSTYETKFHTHTETTVNLSVCTEINTNSTQQSPSWEANSCSDSQEIPRILCVPNVHYRVHKIFHCTVS